MKGLSSLWLCGGHNHLSTTRLSVVVQLRVLRPQLPLGQLLLQPRLRRQRPCSRRRFWGCSSVQHINGPNRLGLWCTAALLSKQWP